MSPDCATCALCDKSIEGTVATEDWALFCPDCIGPVLREAVGIVEGGGAWPTNDEIIAAVRTRRKNEGQ